MNKSGPASWPVRVLGRYVGILLPIGTIFWALSLFRVFDINPFPEQFFSAMLGVAFFSLFLTKPAKPHSQRLSVPWYDWCLALISLSACAYVAVEFPRMVEEIFERKTDAIVIGLVLILVTLEGLRRTTGWVLVIVTVCFIAFGLLGHFIPGELQGRKVDLSRMIIFLGMDSNALFGLPMVVITSIVISFIFFGTALNQSGGSVFFTDLSMAVMGRFRGGAAKIAVTASSLFGSISGSAVSNVVSTGVITIPLMRKAGYSARTAGAIEAVASTGGQLMPPIMGAAAFLMAELIQQPYSNIVWAAIVPSLLYYTAIFIQADIQAARDGLKPVEKHLIPKFSKVFKSGWFYLLPFIVLIYALFWLNETPEMSALYGTLALVLGWIAFGDRGRRPKPRDMVELLVETGQAVLGIVMIGAAAGIIIGVLNISSLGFALTLVLVKFAGGNLILLLILAALVCIVLGMGLPTVGVYILLATLVAPAIVELGVPILSAHLFVLYFGMMSMITPPVAIAAFTAASLARAEPIPTAIEAVKFGWTAFIVPFLFIFSPALLMQGDVFIVLGSVVTAVLGVWLASQGIMAYARAHLNTGYRLAYLISGLALLTPFDLFSQAVTVNVGGGVLALILLFKDYRPRPHTASSSK
ncbi:MAG: TRAP transporter fused permease subunit [Rhodospirillales bacterium]